MDRRITLDTTFASGVAATSVLAPDREPALAPPSERERFVVDRRPLATAHDEVVGGVAPPADEPATASVRNGPAVAAIVAAGIGTACLGIIVTAEGAFADFSRALNIVHPVGPLSGKTTLMVALWLVAWGAFHMAWRNRDVNFARAARATGILLVLGLLGTFPPMFDFIGSLIEHH